MMGFHRVEVVALVACFSLIGVIFELVRRRKIKERYSLLWFFTGVSMLALTLKRDWLERFSSTVGIYYAPSSLFLLLSGFMILILIHYSTVISQLLSQNQKLGQKLALLEADLEELKDGLRRGDGGPGVRPFPKSSPSQDKSA
jgi:hypothetical protein